MESVKKKIFMSRQQQRTIMQITIDEDKNVPDSKPDVERLITDAASVEMEETICREGKAELKGRLNYQILYGAAQEEKKVSSLSGTIAFKDYVRLEDADDKSMLQVDVSVEDLTVEMVHSRKLRIQALLTFAVTAEGIYEEEFLTDAQSEEPLQIMHDEIPVTRMAVQTRDTFRVRDELEISAGKPNMAELVWDETGVRGVEYRAMEGKIGLRGDLVSFVLYYGEGEHIPLQWQEFAVPFSGSVDVPESTEDMVPVLEIRPVHTHLEIKQDEDGEYRLLEAEVMLELRIRLYKEETVEMITDMYSPVKEVKLKERRAHLENLCMRNSARCKLSERVTLPQGEKIFQICHGSGNVVMDEAVIAEGGLRMEGVLHVTMLYAAADDDTPLKSMKGSLPFSYLMEVPDIDTSCHYRVRGEIESLNIMMLGMEEAEIKAAVLLEGLVLSSQEKEILEGAEMVPYDEERLREMPGVIGYVVQPGDSLWKIAKKYFTTVERIRETNPGMGAELHIGDKLLLVKQAEELS